MAIGSLAVRVSANTAQFNRSMRSTQKPARNLTRRMASVGAAAAKMGASLAAAATGGLALLTRNGIKAVTEQGRLARSLAITNKEVAGLTTAFNAYGLQQDEVSDALNTLTDRAQDAISGTESMADNFRLVGLSVDELRGKNPEELMKTFADAVADTEDPTKRSAAIIRTFGDDLGRKLAPMLMKGSENLERFEEEAEKLGVAVSNVESAQVEQASQAMSRIGDVIQGIANQMAVEFAPILRAISERIVGLAGDSNGFRDAIRAAMDGAITAIGWVLDGFHTMKSTTQLVTAAVWTLEAVTQQVFASLARGFQGWVNTAISGINTVISAVNRIPNVDIGLINEQEVTAGITYAANYTSQKAREAREEFRRMLDVEPPSERLKSAVDDARAASEKSAQAQVEQQRRVNQQVGALQDKLMFGRIESLDRTMRQEREKRQSNLEKVREYLQTEFEAEKEQQALRMEWLRKARESELVTEREFRARKEALERKHQQRLTQAVASGSHTQQQFVNASMKAQLSSVAGNLQQMTSAVAKENEAMFRLNQAAGIANATISAYEGFNQALAAYPPPLSYVMAASQLAAGMAQVSKIKSQSMSSGGGGGTSGGTTAATQAGARSTQQGMGAGGGGEETVRRTEVNIGGMDDDAMFSGRQVRRLIEGINEELDGGMVIRA